MTKSVKLLIAAIALIFSASVIAIILGMKKSDSTCVEVVQNNRIIYRFDLSQDNAFLVKSNAISFWSCSYNI